MRPLNDRDDGVLDALLPPAFFEDEARRMPPLTGPLPELDHADRDAPDALGPDLVRRVLQEEGNPSEAPQPPDEPPPPTAPS